MGMKQKFPLHETKVSPAWNKSFLQGKLFIRYRNKDKGRTEIKALRSIKNLGAYVCKYLTKEEFDLYHKHSYHLSRGLKKPEVLTTDGYIGQWRDMYSNIHENTKVIYSNATEFVYAGADGSIQSNTIFYEQGIFK